MAFLFGSSAKTAYSTTHAIERLTRGLKAAFDPAGILNPGRMYANL